jgi:hypothetical protein
MSQVVGWPGNGIDLGSRVRILTGVGDPNSSSTPDVQSAALGSLFLRTDVAGLYLCTTAGVTALPTVAAQPAVWTAK